MVGPFVDETDGKTAETALTISQADVRLSKNAGNMAQKSDNTALVHDEIGIYLCELDATDTDTLGVLGLFVHEAGALPVRLDFMVLPANVWDSLFGSDKLQVDVAQLSGDAQSLTDLKDFADAGYDPSVNKVEGVKLADALTANNDKTGYQLTVTPPSAGAIADAVWDEALSGHQGAGSTGEALEAAASSTLAGPGALQRTIGVTVGGNPLEGASVWVATDAAGTNVVAGPLTTNSMGTVTVLLDAGTFYVWVQKDTYNAIVGQQITIN
jgi:hypothetical protein